MEKDTRRLASASVILGMLAVTLFPVHAGLLKQLHGFQLGFSPAAFMEGSRYLFLFDFLQNILLFLPLGFLIADGHPQDGPRAMAIRAALLSFLLSSLIECAQVRIPGRYPSFWDIGFNSLGGLLGAALNRFLGALPPDQSMR